MISFPKEWTMSEQDARRGGAGAQESSEEELFQELRAYFTDEAGGAGLSPEEERCLRRVAGDVRGRVYTRSQVERAIERGWRPCEDLLSQGN
jgi:hypothetical protein